MVESIYRIVHLLPRNCRAYLAVAGNIECNLTVVCQNILSLSANSIVTFLDGEFQEMPSVAGLTKDTEIVLGGGFSDACVVRHEQQLRKNGFNNLRWDYSLLVSEQDHDDFERGVPNFKLRFTAAYINSYD